MAQIYDFKEIIYLFQLHFKIVSDVCLSWFLGIRTVVIAITTVLMGYALGTSQRLRRSQWRTLILFALFLFGYLVDTVGYIFDFIQAGIFQAFGFVFHF